MNDNLPKLVLPVSDAEEAGRESDKKPAHSPSIKSRSNLDLPVRNQRYMSSPLLRYPPTPEPPLEEQQKELENEEELREEYEQKAACVLSLLIVDFIIKKTI